MAVHDCELDTGTVCSLLVGEESRAVLRCLDSEGTATLDELAMALRLEGENPDADQAFQIRLYHIHLPKLADEGMIVWNKETGQASLTDQGEQLLSYLDRLDG